MGEAERLIRKKIRRTRINSAIIATLAGSGLIAITIVAPNILTILKSVTGKHLSQKKQSINRSLTRLIDDGYVRSRGQWKDKCIELTEKGERFAALLGEGRLAPKKPKRWDGKWRILIFDIPETRKKTRQQIRLTLTGLGFVRLQNSVWIYPYDCEDFVSLFKIDFKIGKELLYIIADSVEGQASLQKYFGIKKR